MKTNTIRTFLYMFLLLTLGSSIFAQRNTENNDKLFEISKNMEIFSNIYKELNTNYVDDLDPSHLMRIGIDAMLNSLDPYTVYYSESEIERYRYLTEGKYDGIGADVEFIDDYVTLTQLYKGYAADREGLRAGDKIVELDGKSTEGKTTEELSVLMKGAQNKNLELTIYRPSTDERFPVSIQRDEVNLPNVPYKGMVSNEVGYVSLTTFTRNAGPNVRNAIKTLKEENPAMESVIIDLRFNGGGLLSEAVNLVNIFIPKSELVVSTKSKVKDRDKTYKTRSTPLDLEMPVVVLVNDKSASASEIVSGTLQDYDRAVIMGQKTYGKGLVQNKRKLGYNTQMKLTTAKYYIPSGRCIQSVEYEDGEPVDIPVEQRAEFKTSNGRTVLDGGGVFPDVQLEKPKDPPVIKALQEQKMIFKYVNHFQAKNESIPEIDEFSFSDYNEFLEFLDENKFNYRTESEKKLSNLREKLREEAYYDDVSSSLSDIEEEMTEAKKDGLKKYEEKITDLIEKEIASRYYYELGQIKQRLKDDSELEAAIELLNDQKRYNSILEG